MNLLRDTPFLVRKPNRPAPEPVIKSKPDVIVWHDDDTVSIHHMTRREAELVYEACCNSPHLYAMTYVLGTMLGLDRDEVS